MPTIYVPRVFGSVLVITTGSVPSNTFELVTATRRDHRVTATRRDQAATATRRDEVVTTGSRG